MSKIMSRRAAAIRSASSNSESPWRIGSLESGADRELVNGLPVRGRFPGNRFAIGIMHDVKNAGIDFERQNSDWT